MLSNENLMGSEKLLWKYQMYSPSVPWKYFYMHKYDDATLLIAYLTSIIRLVNILVISGQNFPWHIKDAMVHTEIIFTRFYINLQTFSDSNIIFFFFWRQSRWAWDMAEACTLKQSWTVEDLSLLALATATKYHRLEV